MLLVAADGAALVGASQARIQKMRIFEEPLIPVGLAMDARENGLLMDALNAYAMKGQPEHLQPLEAFLKEHPSSCWRASLLVNMGLRYRETGYFLKAMEAWEEAWRISKQVRGGAEESVALRALGELAELNARLGRMDRLQQLLDESTLRPLSGIATEKVAGAREGLHLMKTRPDRAFRCGPLALTMIQAIKDARAPWDPKLDALDSTPKGTSLAMNQKWAQELGMNFQAAKRNPGAAVVFPSLVHWKAGHFAALIRMEGERYLVQDPTFGNEFWVSAEALDQEASGFALVPKGDLPEGWSKVSEQEAAQVWGCGAWGPGRPDDTNPDSPKVPKPCDGAPRGMPVYAFHTNVVSLNLVDEPVGYAPPKGPRVGFAVTYNQREYGQPQAFDFSNFGPKWVHDWMSYVKDDTSNLSANVTVFTRGGGSLTFQATGSGVYAVENRRQATLVRNADGTYVVTYRDGHTETYARPDRTATGPRRVFLTQMMDSKGNGIQLAYDATFRLSTITDALGQVTTLAYGLATDPLKITQVTDPFGRTAKFEYGANGYLSKITDAVGLSTSFSYGPTAEAPSAPADFINSMTTPYGTTRFFTDNATGAERWIESEDPTGLRDRLEAGSTYTGLIPLEPIPAIPELTPSYLNPRFGFRNSLYWDKRAYADRQRNFAKAHIYQWGHGAGGFASGILIGEKKPLENRIWYVHAGAFWGGVVPSIAAEGKTPAPQSLVQAQGKVGGLTGETLQSLAARSQAGSHSGAEGVIQKSAAAAVAAPVAIPAVWEGAFNVVTRVVRILEDGTTQVAKNDYDARGVLLRSEDPAGRSTSYVWSVDGLDLLEVRNTTAGRNDLLAKYTYNTQHAPLTAVDAAGQTTTFTYNAAAQLTSISNPKNETTTLTYDVNGYLKKVEGALPGSTTSFTYDAVGRVASVTAADGYVVTYAYDNLDRRTLVTYPDGTTEQTVYDRLDVGSTKDRKGRWTTMLYNPLRQLIEVRDPENRITRLDWCGCGQLEALVDPMGRITSWQRDLQGRVVAKIFPDLKSTSYDYDAAGRLISRKDAKGQITHYAYYADGNLQQVSYANTAVATPTVTYAYDPAFNRLTTMADGTGTTSYTYYPITAAPALGAGRLATATSPYLNSTVTYQYDELGRVVNRSINGSLEARAFDPLGRLFSVINPLGSFSYTYDGLTNRLKTLNYPNGQKTQYTYFDGIGDLRLKQIANLNSEGANISTFDYTYDANGQIATWSQKADAQTPKVYSFTYDAVGQLLKAQLNDGSPTGSLLKTYVYGYDEGGNRLSEQVDSQLTLGTYNSLNQLTHQRASDVSAPIAAPQGGASPAAKPAKAKTPAKSQKAAPVASRSHR